jgi:hypothetical protein
MTVDAPIKNLILPDEHIRIRKIRAADTYLLAARGTFKTTRAIPLFIKDMVYSMPRSTGMMCGLSYEDMGNNTINPFLGGLAELGIYEGERYVFGKKPPDHWEKPYLGILNGKYDRVMSWDNGTAMYTVSMEKKAPANGLSVQWGVFDEVKFQDQNKLIDKIFPTFRGNEDYFKHLSTFQNKLFVTDKEADPAQIKWLLDKRKLVDHELIEIILTYQQDVDELLSYYNHPDASKTFKDELKKEIDQLEAELNEMRKGLVYVSEISIEDVKPYLSKEWYNDKKRNSTPRLWKVVYLNKDPESAGDTFYPNFSKEIHTYQSIDDIDATKPFIFTPDYQHAVSPITISQLSVLPFNTEVSFNYVDEVYTLPEPNESDIQDNNNGSKGGLMEAVQLFCDRHKNHRLKRVFYVYDHTAKGKRVNADKLYEIVIKILKKNKWNVTKIYTGKAPDHYLKYANTSDWLKHEDPLVPAIRINSYRCPKLITSISNAAAKTVAGKTEKNKEYENTSRYPNYDQSETTHFSDCFDMANHAVLFLKKVKATSAIRVSGTR